MVELRCTICKKPVGSDAPAPFCSARCRQIDLGQWLSGRYVIAGEKHVDEAYAPPASDDDGE